MRQTILMLFMMIAVGVFASVQGRDAQSPKVLVVDRVELGQPHVVLAKSGTRQQKEACQLTQPKPNEQDITMKGLVF
jgi:hypothetical protein